MSEDKKDDKPVNEIEKARAKRQKVLQEPMKHPLDAFGDPESIRGYSELTDKEKVTLQECFAEGTDFMLYVQTRADYIMEIARKIRGNLEALEEPEAGSLVAALIVNAVSGLSSMGITGPVASVIFTSIFTQFTEYLKTVPQPPNPNAN